MGRVTMRRAGDVLHRVQARGRPLAAVGWGALPCLTNGVGVGARRGVPMAVQPAARLAPTRCARLRAPAACAMPWRCRVACLQTRHLALSRLTLPPTPNPHPAPGTPPHPTPPSPPPPPPLLHPTPPCRARRWTRRAGRLCPWSIATSCARSAGLAGARGQGRRPWCALPLPCRPAHRATCPWAAKPRWLRRPSGHVGRRCSATATHPFVALFPLLSIIGLDGPFPPHPTPTHHHHPARRMAACSRRRWSGAPTSTCRSRYVPTCRALDG